MFTRPSLNTTVADLSTLLQERDESGDVRRVSPGEIEFHLSSTDPTIKVGQTEAPATETSLQAFGEILQIPSAFLKRASERAQPATLDALFTDLVRNSLQKDARVTMRGNYIQEVDEWGSEPFSALPLVQIAERVIDPRAEVARLVDTPSFFGFDVFAPEGFAHGYGGEGVTPYADGNERNDITAGGLRFGVNLKQNLAPFVQQWLFRLACTNGMEIEKPGLRVDARGQTVDEVLAELEQMAQIAFGSVEREIAAFYELKEQRVANPERAIRAVARERGIPARSAMAIIDLAASEDLPDEPSMFDVINLVTNFANSPSVKNDGGRLLLERAGGAVVSDHAARCGHCNQRVSG